MLSSVAAATGGEVILFRSAHAQLEQGAALPDGFTGSSAFAEFAAAMAKSGLEPAAYAEHLISTAGMGKMSAVANELRTHIWTLSYLVTVDRLNAPRLSVAEHVSRRALQLLRATRKNPRAPCFDGLEYYTEHMDASAGQVKAPKFEAHVMESQRAEAFVLKQARLIREEEESDRKRLAARGSDWNAAAKAEGRGRGRGGKQKGRGANVAEEGG